VLFDPFMTTNHEKELSNLYLKVNNDLENYFIFVILTGEKFFFTKD
jgi:hypothetical protein